MANVYPKQVQFLLADGVRQEQGGKFTVLGFYPGNGVLLNQPLPKKVPDGFKGVALPGLTLIITLFDGNGSFSGDLKIIRPSGELLGKGSTNIVIEKNKGKSASLLIPIEPFPVTEFGDYQATLKLGAHKYDFVFRIGHIDPKASLPGTSTRTSASKKKPNSLAKRTISSSEESNVKKRTVRSARGERTLNS